MSEPDSTLRNENYSLRSQLDARLVESAVMNERVGQLQLALNGIRDIALNANATLLLARTIADDDSACPRCVHPYGPHKMLALGSRPEDGIATICDQPGCLCISTGAAEMPDNEIVEELRDIAQHTRQEVSARPVA